MISPVCNRNADILGADNTASFIQTPDGRTAGEGAVNNRSRIGLGDTAPDSIQPAHVLGCRVSGLETSEKLARVIPADVSSGGKGAGGSFKDARSQIIHDASDNITKTPRIVFIRIGDNPLVAPFMFFPVPFHEVTYGV